MSFADAIFTAKVNITRRNADRRLDEALNNAYDEGYRAGYAAARKGFR